MSEIEVDRDVGRPTSLFMTAATSGRTGSAVAVVFFAYNYQFGTPLRAIDYRLAELRSVHEPAWLYDIYDHADDLRRAYQPRESEETILYAEDLLHGALAQTFQADPRIVRAGERGLIDLYEVDRADILAMTLEQRLLAMEMLVDGGRLMKVRAAARARSTFRNIRTTHLLNALASILTGAKEPPPLAAATALGALLVLTEEGAVSRPSSTRSLSAFGS